MRQTGMHTFLPEPAYAHHQIMPVFVIKHQFNRRVLGMQGLIFGKKMFNAGLIPCYGVIHCKRPSSEIA